MCRVIRGISLGFSLLELLISACLGLLILSIAISGYLGVKRSYHWQQESADFNENLRVVDFILWQNIMQAGSPLVKNVETKYLEKEPKQFGIYGYSSSGYLPRYLVGKVAENSDVIVVVNARLNSDLTLDKNTLQKRAFYLGKATQKKSSHNSEYALRMCTDENGDNDDELVFDIEGMNILYGIAEAGVVTRYLTAEQVTFNKLWGRVGLVAITLKMRRGDNLVTRKLYIKLRSRS